MPETREAVRHYPDAPWGEHYIDGTRLLGDKYLAAYKTVAAMYGVANVAATGALVYDSVFYPSGVLAAWGIGESEPELPSLYDTLAAPLPGISDRLPGRDEFINRMRYAVTRGIDHRACLYQSADTVVESAMLIEPVAIWTQGDVLGQAARTVFGRQQPAWPGSHEQHWKVIGGGFAHSCYALAQAAIGASAPVSEKYLRAQTMLGVVARENKLSDEAVCGLAAYFKRLGVNQVAVYEDRLDNIRWLQSTLTSHGIEVQGVWVRQGQYGKKGVIGDQENIRTIETIGEALELIQADRAPSHGTIFDFDGVLSNQLARIEEQKRALASLFELNGWAFC